MDIRTKTCVIIRKNGEYLVGYVLFSHDLRWSDSPYDAWKTRNIEKAAGVDHVHPHKFRRTLATGLCRHGMPIQEVANVLGHEKIDTTMRYVVLNQEETKHNYRRYA